MNEDFPYAPRKISRKTSKRSSATAEAYETCDKALKPNAKSKAKKISNATSDITVATPTQTKVASAPTPAAKKNRKTPAPKNKEVKNGGGAPIDPYVHKGVRYSKKPSDFSNPNSYFAFIRHEKKELARANLQRDLASQKASASLSEAKSEKSDTPASTSQEPVPSESKSEEESTPSTTAAHSAASPSSETKDEDVVDDWESLSDHEDEPKPQISEEERLKDFPPLAVREHESLESMESHVDEIMSTYGTVVPSTPAPKPRNLNEGSAPVKGAANSNKGVEQGKAKAKNNVKQTRSQGTRGGKKNALISRSLNESNSRDAAVRDAQAMSKACYEYAKTGKCKRKNCRFSHDDEPSSPLSGESPPPTLEVKEKKKTFEETYVESSLSEVQRANSKLGDEMSFSYSEHLRASKYVNPYYLDIDLTAKYKNAIHHGCFILICTLLWLAMAFYHCHLYGPSEFENHYWDKWIPAFLSALLVVNVLRVFINILFYLCRTLHNTPFNVAAGEDWGIPPSPASIFLFSYAPDYWWGYDILPWETMLFFWRGFYLFALKIYFGHGFGVVYVDPSLKTSSPSYKRLSGFWSPLIYHPDIYEEEGEVYLNYFKKRLRLSVCDDVTDIKFTDKYTLFNTEEDPTVPGFANDVRPDELRVGSFKYSPKMSTFRMEVFKQEVPFMDNVNGGLTVNYGRAHITDLDISLEMFSQLVAYAKMNPGLSEGDTRLCLNRAAGRMVAVNHDKYEVFGGQHIVLNTVLAAFHYSRYLRNDETYSLLYQPLN